MKIEHNALYVKDLEKMKEFFIKYFKANPNELYHNKTTDFKSYFLTFDEGSRLEVMTRPELMENNPGNSVGFAHMALSVGSKEKVDELTEELRKDGYSVVSGPRTTGDGYYESVIEGPEGILFEITV